jgi:hypothetical protein
MVLRIAQLEAAKELQAELQRLQVIAERERFDMLAYLIGLAFDEAREIQRTARPT